MHFGPHVPPKFGPPRGLAGFSGITLVRIKTPARGPSKPIQRALSFKRYGKGERTSSIPHCRRPFGCSYLHKGRLYGTMSHALSSACHAR